MWGRIVFDSDEEGDQNLYVIDADGGAARRLTPGPSSDVTGTWSRDGRWIYFNSDRSGSAQIWKIPAEGGDTLQVTKGGGSYAVESWDGHHLYYSRAGSVRSIRRVPVAGGEETLVAEEPDLMLRGHFVSRSGRAADSGALFAPDTARIGGRVVAVTGPGESKGRGRVRRPAPRARPL